MINLTTGVPGAGKTLFTIYLVKQQAEKENRPVYYHGINDLRLPWTELANPEEWYKVPPGSIVVLDECQRIFRPRSLGKEPPQHVVQLETHRHAGIDLWLITQSPMLVESNVRRLVGIHRHVNRMMGTGAATIMEWQNKVVDRPEQPGARETATKVKMLYPKEVYGYYKSAEVHTHKPRIPFRVFVFFVAILVAIGASWFSYERFKPHHQDEQAKASAAAANHAAAPAGGKGQPPMTKAEYLESYAPRVPGLPSSASRYDDVMKPTRAPKPVAAVLGGGKCRVYSQDGTRLPDVPDAMCRSLVEYGYFDDAPDKPRNDERLYQVRDQQGVQQALQRVPDARSVVGIQGQPYDASAMAVASKSVLASDAPTPMTAPAPTPRRR